MTLRVGVTGERHNWRHPIEVHHLLEENTLDRQNIEYRRQDGSSLCRIFFFQAEDGIRDLTVTGVQTCALPISRDDTGRAARSPAPPTSCASPKTRWCCWRTSCPTCIVPSIREKDPMRYERQEIGRASCRERV